MEYQININSVYGFMFSSLLSEYDEKYLLITILNYDDILSQGIDLYAKTYEPLGISLEDFKVEFNQFKTGRILKLQQVDDVEIIRYIPEFHVIETPNINIKAYQHLGLVINLGFYDDADKLETIRNEVNAVIQGNLGITNNSSLFTIKEKWLTNAEYLVIDEERNNNITEISSVYKDNIAIEKELIRLRGIIECYEEIIINNIES